MILGMFVSDADDPATGAMLPGTPGAGGYTAYDVGGVLVPQDRRGSLSITRPVGLTTQTPIT